MPPLLSTLILVFATTSSMGRHMTIGRHERDADPRWLEEYAAHAGFTVDEIEDMKQNDVSLYLAATKALNMRQKALTGGAPIGAEPDLVYIELLIGQAQLPYRLNLDTGSSTLAIHHEDCGSCGVHCNIPYTYNLTTTQLSCDAEACCGQECSAAMCAPSPQTHLCGYEVSYLDGSGVEGAWVRDLVTVSGLSPIPMYFGAILRSYGSFEPFNVDGIIGVSLSSINTNKANVAFPTIIDELHASLAVKRIFSLCFGLNGGHMMFGDVDLDHMTQPPVYVPYDGSSGFYDVYVNQTAVGNHVISTAHYAIVDSGTTLYYTPSRTYQMICDALAEAASNADPSGNLFTQVNKLIGNQCVKMSPESLELLPSISVTFSNGAVASVGAQHYIRTGLCSSPTHYSLGIADGGSCGTLDDQCLYGDVFMLPYTWVFDQESSRMGFAPRKDCDVPESTISTCPNKEPGDDSKYVRIILLAVLIPVFVIGTCLAIALVLYCSKKRRTQQQQQQQATSVRPI